MRRPALYTVLLLLVLSCRPTANTVIGTYQQQAKAPAKLIIKEDKTFEFAGKETAISNIPSEHSADMHFLTSGTWEIKSDQLLLNSFSTEPGEPENNVTDSLVRFTSITSFNFCDQYGDPVMIRSILLPAGKPKPHFGNTLYLFAQDFKPKDTLVFHFDGYPDFRYPGTIPYTIGNNTHKITLRGPYLPAAFFNTAFIPKKNKLLTARSHTVFTKKD